MLQGCHCNLGYIMVSIAGQPPQCIPTINSHSRLRKSLMTVMLAMAGCSIVLPLLAYLARFRLAKSLLLLHKSTGPPREPALLYYCMASTLSRKTPRPDGHVLAHINDVPVAAGSGNVALVMTDVEGSTELWEWVIVKRSSYLALPGCCCLPSGSRVFRCPHTWSARRIAMRRMWRLLCTTRYTQADKTHLRPCF